MYVLKSHNFRKTTLTFLLISLCFPDIIWTALGWYTSSFIKGCLQSPTFSWFLKVYEYSEDGTKTTITKTGIQSQSSGFRVEKKTTCSIKMVRIIWYRKGVKIIVE